MVGSGYRAAAVLVVAAGVAFAAFLLVRPEAGSVSGSLVEVSRNVESGAYRVGDFVLVLEEGRRWTPPSGSQRSFSRRAPTPGRRSGRS